MQKHYFLEQLDLTGEHIYILKTPKDLLSNIHSSTFYFILRIERCTLKLEYFLMRGNELFVNKILP